MTELKSKITELYDFRNVDLTGIAESFSMSNEELSAKIERIRKKHSVQTEADSVEKEDFVTLSCKSDTAKFNKDNIVIRVCAGLFSKELEEKIIGMTIGEEKTVSVDKNEVCVKIIKISRRVIPALTDEVVLTYGIDGVKTVDELRKYIYNAEKKQYIEENAEGIASYVSEKAAENSRVELDEGDLEFLREEGREFARTMIKASGLSDESTDEEFIEKTGQTREAFTSFLIDITVNGIFGTLVGMKMMNEDGARLTPEQYEAALKEYIENMGCTPQEAEKSFSYRKFVMQQASNYYFEKIVKYVEDYLDKE